MVTDPGIIQSGLAARATEVLDAARVEYLGRRSLRQSHGRARRQMAAMLAGLSYGSESADAFHAMSQTAGAIFPTG
jgi:alcohol dehydrogenase class IV